MSPRPVPQVLPRAAWLLTLSTLALALPSCGNGWKKCHPAQGKVLLDGKPVAGAEVWLIPTAPELMNTNPPVRPFGKTGPDGSFTLMTYVAGDGAPAGAYKARVICEKRVKGAKAGDDDDEGEGGLQNVLPGRYADPEKSGLLVTIQPGSNVVPDFNLKR
jgi:hypothetical protein